MTRTLSIYSAYDGTSGHACLNRRKPFFELLLKATCSPDQDEARPSPLCHRGIDRIQWDALALRVRTHALHGSRLIAPREEEHALCSDEAAGVHAEDGLQPVVEAELVEITCRLEAYRRELRVQMGLAYRRELRAQACLAMCLALMLRRQQKVLQCMSSHSIHRQSQKKN